MKKIGIKLTIIAGFLLCLSSTAGAAVDVYSTEPYCGELVSLPNVILTPHIGAHTMEARSRMETEAAQDLVRVLRGESPLNPVY